MQRKFIYDGGASKRFHTCLTLRSQDIAAHSFGVAWWCELLTRGEASKNLIMAALAHDLAEHMVGDIPSPAKRAMDMSSAFHEYELKHLRTAGLASYADALNNVEEFILKIADCLDGCMFCIKELELGNMSIIPVFERFLEYSAEYVKAAKPFSTFDSVYVSEILTSIHYEWAALKRRYML